jgi:hypothetical protein
MPSREANAVAAGWWQSAGSDALRDQSQESVVNANRWIIGVSALALSALLGREPAQAQHTTGVPG